MIQREMGEDSGSMGIEAMTSEARELILRVRARSSVASWVVSQSETVVREVEIMRGEMCFWDQDSRGVLMRFFCSIHQDLVRLGRLRSER